MTAAARAAERGKRVLLLERGPSLGRKLLITAGGRCNVTNSAPNESFMEAFGRQGQFLRDALRAFNAARLLDWLHSRGIETVEERKGRVFPASQDAQTILHALTNWMAAGGVEVRLNTRVEKLICEDSTVQGIRAGGKEIHAPNVLIATGGLSYPGTGSTGDGYALARQAGHTVEEPFPAIIAFETEEDWPRRLQGTPIKNVSITARQGGRKIAETFGEALWTHYGIGGPSVFDISTEIVLALREGPISLHLDLRPNDDEKALDERLLFAIKKQGKKQVDNIVAEWTGQRTATMLVELAGIDPRKKMNQCGKSDRRKLTKLVKNLELRIKRPRPIDEAIVTGGGVPIAEIDPRRMASRFAPGLFFAGEIVALHGPTGGYNLQQAFSTGWLVGERV